MTDHPSRNISNWCRVTLINAFHTSIHLTNAKSLGKQTRWAAISDLLQLLFLWVLFVAESWLRPNIPDASVEVPGRTLHCHDGNKDSKGRGIELCAYVLQGWCHNSRIIDSDRSPVLEATVEGVHIVPEDFNQVCLKSVFPKFCQHGSVLPGETGHWTICTVTSSMPTERHLSPNWDNLTTSLCSPFFLLRKHTLFLYFLVFLLYFVSF